MMIKNLLETMWLVRYSWPVEITYDQGGEFLGHEFKTSLIKNEYGIKTKPDSPGNQQWNEIIERIHHVFGNLVHTYNLQETYVDDADPCVGILTAEAFTVRSTYHRTKEKSLGSLIFIGDMILLINHVAYWRYIRQHKQPQINKDVNRENTTIIDNNY